MTSADLLRLIRFVVDNRLRESHEIVESMTMQEREVLAKGFEAGATFLRKVNKDWQEALNEAAKAIQS